MPNPADYYWDDWALLGLQAATLIALIVYVVKTWQMASATREAASATAGILRAAEEARLEALAPRILIYFGGEGSVADVNIVNVGAGTALDVTFVFDPPLRTSQKGRDPMAFFQQPKTALPPGYRISHFFDVWHSYLNADPPLPRSYCVRIEYQGAENGRKYTAEHVLDTSAIENLVTVQPKTLDDVVTQFDKLNSALGAWAKRLLETAEINRDLSLYEDHGRDLPSALAAFESVWRFYLAAESDPRVRQNYDALRSHLLRASLSALRAAYAVRAPEDTLQQLQRLSLLFVRTDAMGAWASDEWQGEVERALLMLNR